MKRPKKSGHELASEERIVKRMAGRYGWSLLKAAKPFGKVLEHGGYMLRDDANFQIMFGNKGYDHSATLEECEEFLTKLKAAEKD